MDGWVIRLLPIYLDYGRRGYRSVFDRQLISEEAAQVAVSESNIGSAVYLGGFGIAYGVVRLASVDEDAVGIVRCRTRPSGDGRGLVVVRFVGIASWQEIEGCQRDMGFVFRRLDERVPLDRSPTEEDLRPLELCYSPDYDRPSSVAPLPAGSEGSLIKMLAGLMAGARVVAVGYDRLEDQLALVRQLWGLLPDALARDLSFVTNALSLPEVRARLVFATLVPLPSMGRLLRTSAGGKHSLIYDPPKKSIVDPGGKRKLIERYFEIATQGVEQYGWEGFSRLVQETIVHPAARLDAPESFVPFIEQKLGLELFHRRRRDGQATPAEMVQALERHHGQMGTEELKACLFQALNCLEQQKLTLKDLAFLRESLPSWLERGVDPLEFGREVASVCASERVDLEVVKFFLDSVVEIFPPWDRWGADYREVLDRLLSELYRRGMRSPRPSLFVLFQPYAAWLDASLFKQVFIKAQIGPVNRVKGSVWEGILQDWSMGLDQLKSQSPQERANLEAGLAALCETLLGALADHDPLKAMEEWLWLLDRGGLPKQEVVRAFPHQGDRAQRYLPEQKREIAKQLLKGVIGGRFAGVESDLLQSSWGFWLSAGLTNTARAFHCLLGGRPPQSAGLLANCEQELRDTLLFLRFCQLAVKRQPQLFDGDLARHLDHLATQEGIVHYGDPLRGMLGIASKNEFVAGAEEVIGPLLSLSGKLQAADQFVTLLKNAEGVLGAEEVAQRIARYWSTAFPEGQDALCRAVLNSELSREAKQAAVEKIWMGVADGPRASDALLELTINFPPSLTMPHVQRKLARALWPAGQPSKGTGLRRVTWLTHLIVAAVRTQDPSALVEIDRLLYTDLQFHRDSYLLEYQQALRELLDRRALDQMGVERLGKALRSAGRFWLAHLTRMELSLRRTGSEYVDDLITRLFELEGSLVMLEKWNRQQHVPWLRSIDESKRQQLLNVCKSIQKILDRPSTARSLIGGRSSWLQSVLKEIHDALGTSST